MLRVNKCCYFFSLKYGFYTFGVISLILRISLAASLYFVPSSLMATLYNSQQLRTIQSVLPGIGFLIGWFLTSSAVLFVALKGIIEKKSMLLYPFIVISVMEVIMTLPNAVFMSAKLSAWYSVQILYGVIDVYVIICLISLFKEIKQKEKDCQKSKEEFPLTTV